MKQTGNSMFFALYYKRLTMSFMDNVQRARVRMSVKVIHQTRLDVKRMRAIFLLMETMVPGFKQKKHYRQALSLFKQSGQLRELQVSLMLLKKYGLSPATEAFEKQLRTEQQRMRRGLKRAFVEFDDKKFVAKSLQVEQLCKPVTQRQLQQQTRRVITDRGESIKKLRAVTFSFERLHKIRTHLKRLGAVAALLYDMEPAPQLKALMKSVKVTETTIGNWHDRVLLLATVNKFQDEHPDEKLDDLKQQIEQDNNHLLAQLDNQLNDTLGLLKGYKK